MDTTADLPLIYADFGETVTVDGVSVTAIFDGGFLDAGGLGVDGTVPSLRCVASDVSSAANGDTVVRAGVTYIIRRMELLAPDEVEVRLILEAQ